MVVSPPLGRRPLRTEVRGTLLLDHCVSPDGTAAGLRSAEVVLRMSGLASCNGVRDVTGSGRVTWYRTAYRGGPPWGTSELGVAARVDDWSAAGPLPTIQVRSGPLSGHTVTVGTVGTPRMMHCSTQGVGSLAGSFRVSVRR
ncbi:hypothetical protein [Streptomyces hesseae]|uniref:Ig-like domain-containing protein n=1 Tax=Streptomyces hesseae TaxID=3075519 RepID=A0ABU2SGK7_9ACTN|nr:hypothetical protein [Streptomyces sp. DSM 40473]MDT0448027.1 hypothetical protein [Streptomyces sp. DSM 40473]